MGNPVDFSPLVAFTDERLPLFPDVLTLKEKSAAFGKGRDYAAWLGLVPRQMSTGGRTNLASLYQAQGNYADAEPLYRRSLAINEKVLGPEHPDVAQSLENYAALLRKTGRADEAVEMEARAKAIRAKYE